MFCLQVIKDSVNILGKVCYITTSQPRQDGSFPDLPSRQKLKVIRDSIINRFGVFAIDFYTPVTNMVDYTILPQYSAGDNIHLNNAGHAVLFQQVKAKNIFNLIVPVKLTSFLVRAEANKAIVSWSVTDEAPQTIYSLQRSADGTQFETVHEWKAIASGGRKNYEYADEVKDPGTFYYRLFVQEINFSFYSSVKKILVRTEVTIEKIAMTHQELRIFIKSERSQRLIFNLINSSGALVKSIQWASTPGRGQLNCSTATLAAGIYFLEMRTVNERIALAPFIKK
jgi:hypothetical protein